MRPAPLAGRGGSAAGHAAAMRDATTDATPKPGEEPKRRTLSRESWIAAALKVLERRGIASVKIDLLAKQLRVTRGSFYFHFADLKDLQQAMLEEWRTRNCRPFLELAAEEGHEGKDFFDRIVTIWVAEDPFSPMLDLAIRDWSRSAAKLAAEVAAMDDLRLALLTRSFRTMGYDADESLVRARITYFHQIGYYATFFKENATDRRRYQPIFGRVLLGPLAEEAK